MRIIKRGGAATLAVAANLALGVSTVAAGNGATIETFPLDDRWSHEEPTGEVFWFDVTGDVRIVTTADGRSSGPCITTRRRPSCSATWSSWSRRASAPSTRWASARTPT